MRDYELSSLQDISSELSKQVNNYTIQSTILEQYSHRLCSIIQFSCMYIIEFVPKEIMISICCNHFVYLFVSHLDQGADHVTNAIIHLM